MVFGDSLYATNLPCIVVLHSDTLFRESEMLKHPNAMQVDSKIQLIS